MTLDTPIWVCAYANNQWELSNAISDDPKDSGFAKAMTVAQNRAITIVDKGAIVFKRIWCCYELYLTLIEAEQNEDGKEAKGEMWEIYTAHTHNYKCREETEERQAVGIISGGATIDYGVDLCIKAREKSFSFELISKAFNY